MRNRQHSLAWPNNNGLLDQYHYYACNLQPFNLGIHCSEWLKLRVLSKNLLKPTTHKNLGSVKIGSLTFGLENLLQLYSNVLFEVGIQPNLIYCWKLKTVPVLPHTCMRAHTHTYNRHIYHNKFQVSRWKQMPKQHTA